MDYTALSPTDVALQCLRTGEESAWIEFVRRFQPLIAGVVIRMARRWGEASPDVVDDLVQETYLKLCSDRQSLLQTFHPEHPDAIFGYIKVFTANLVHDHFKALRAEKRGGTRVESPTDSDHEANWVSPTSDPMSIERTVLIGQIDASLRAVDSGPNVERDRKIFWLYYRSGLSANAIASIPAIGLTTKGVESALLRLTRLVRGALAAPTTESKEKQQDSSQDQKGFRQAESF